MILIALCCTVLYSRAQSRISLKDTTRTKQFLITLNQALDQAVVDKKAAFMQTHYAPDFYFLHSTGMIDSKSSWMKAVLDTATRYRSRLHDSVMVELHNDIAIVAGSLNVKRPAQNKVTGYALRYIRVYANRKNLWQLLSHRSTAEWKLPDAPL